MPNPSSRKITYTRWGILVSTALKGAQVTLERWEADAALPPRELLRLPPQFRKDHVSSYSIMVHSASMQVMPAHYSSSYPDYDAQLSIGLFDSAVLPPYSIKGTETQATPDADPVMILADTPHEESGINMGVSGVNFTQGIWARIMPRPTILSGVGVVYPDLSAVQSGVFVTVQLNLIYTGALAQPLKTANYRI